MGLKHLRAMRDVLGKTAPLSDGTGAKAAAAILHRIRRGKRAQVHDIPSTGGIFHEIGTDWDALMDVTAAAEYGAATCRRDILVARCAWGRVWVETAPLEQQKELPFRPPRPALDSCKARWHGRWMRAKGSTPHRCRDPCP